MIPGHYERMVIVSTNLETLLYSIFMAPFYSKLNSVSSVSFFLSLFLSLSFFLEGGERKEKDRERTSMCGCLSRPPTGDLARNPGMRPDLESNGDPLVRRSMLNPRATPARAVLLPLLKNDYIR